MTKRVAFFADKIEIETYFGISSERENLFQPHYNLSPGQHIPIVRSEDNELTISRVRWGESGSSVSSTSLPSENTEEELEKKNTSRCVIPLSGFYVWKENREKDHPFFVRMLNAPVMSVAGICYDEGESYFKLISTESNPLIYPMSKIMPVLLDKTLANEWLNSPLSAGELLDKAGDLFLLTDISVMRVNKKVNDPTLNDPSLVQPIPK